MTVIQNVNINYILMSCCTLSPPLAAVVSPWLMFRLHPCDFYCYFRLQDISSGYWVLVLHFTRREAVRQIDELQHIATNLGRSETSLLHFQTLLRNKESFIIQWVIWRKTFSLFPVGRAWLYLALSESSLESYLRLFQENQALLQKYYFK